MTKQFLLAATALLGVATAPAAQAQQSVDLIMDNFTSSVLSQTTTMLNNNAVMSAYGNSAYRTPASYNAGKAAGRRAAATSTRAASTTYTPTASARQQAISTQNSKSGRSAATAQQFAATFGPGGSADYTTLYRKVVAGSGLRENDIADAYAAYLTATYQVAHGASPLVPASATAVRTQFAPAVGRAAAGKSAATLAALGEYLKLQTALLYVGNQQPNPTFQRNVAATLNQRFHLDVMALTLTDKGFVKK